MKRGPQKATPHKLSMRSFLYEQASIQKFDELQHWSRHPEVLNWESKMRVRKRVAVLRSHLRCVQCGAPLPMAKRIFCSEKCSTQSGIDRAAQRFREDSAFRERRRAIGRKTWLKTKTERPEVYRANYLKKLANPLFRLIKNHRSRLWELVGKRSLLKDRTSLEYFGCSTDFLKRHLESQFGKTMTWENYGTAWVVDHIVPIAAFRLEEEAEQLRCFNWQNLRPMLKKKNAIKSAKLSHPQSHLPLVAQ